MRSKWIIAVVMFAAVLLQVGCGTSSTNVPGQCPTCGTTVNGAYGVIDIIPVPEHNPTGEPIPNVITPENVPEFNAHTDAFTAGINWYLNYWVKYQVNFEVDRLRDPSVIGIVPQNYFVLLQRLQFRF